MPGSVIGWLEQPMSRANTIAGHRTGRRRAVAVGRLMMEKWMESPKGLKRGASGRPIAQPKAGFGFSRCARGITKRIALVASSMRAILLSTRPTALPSGISASCLM